MNANQEDNVRRAFERLGSTRQSRRDLLALFGGGMAASLHTACLPSSAPAVEDHVNDVEGVRIGFDRAYALDGVDPGLASAIEVAVGELERLGAQVVGVQVPDVTGVLAVWPVICAVEAVEAHRET